MNRIHRKQFPNLLFVNEKILDYTVIILLFVVSLQDKEDVAEDVSTQFSTRVSTKLLVLMIVFSEVDVE